MIKNHFERARAQERSDASPGVSRLRAQREKRRNANGLDLTPSKARFHFLNSPSAGKIRIFCEGRVIEGLKVVMRKK